ncbi:MAG: hypothetical protein IJ037_05215, partial [Clostridia bacterium]|nr:hypothetical protein [Clostridia bacterium]
NNNYPIRPLSPEYYDFLGKVKNETEASDLRLGYLDDTYVMRQYLAGLDNPEEAACKVLCNYEYACTEGQHLRREIHKSGKLMALCAVNDDTLAILDLREFVHDGVLEWDVPEGNWIISEFICEPEISSHFIDLMDYAVSREYLTRTFGALCDRLSRGDENKSPVDLFLYRNILYAGQNRRMWNPEFNTVFEEMYGFDPAPYYPLMFRSFPGNSKRYKCMLFKCRSRMMVEGYLKAAADFCKARDVFCTGFPAEAKCTACSWMFGDGQMLHTYSSAPGISMPFAYLYGINGIKVAAGAADMSGTPFVTADLFNYYDELTRDIIYREAMNAYVRGVNSVFAHLGEDRTRENTDIVETAQTSWGSIFSKGDDLADFAGFTTRVQSLLRGGDHVSEVGIVYPINTIHSLVYLYHSDFSGFEYPFTPESCDYMELMNNFLGYVGIDSTFIHPETMVEKAFSENGILYLDNGRSMMKYKLLVMPSMSIMSLKTLRVIRKYFDAGGKIIATDSLAKAAVETSLPSDDVNAALHNETPEDAEIREIIRHIFGKDATDPSIYRAYYKNENENGGAAYYFPSNKTAADGTGSVSANILYQATQKFNIAPDVYIDRMPRRELLGMVNYSLPDFRKVGVHKRLAKSCSMNYLHKRYAGCDIFYFTNTSGDAYNGSILLRGRHTPEEWNPYTGKIHKLTTELVRFRGEIYTRVDASIEASSCTFFVSPIQRTQKEIIRDFTDGEDIPEFFAKENF